MQKARLSLCSIFIPIAIFAQMTGIVSRTSAHPRITRTFQSAPPLSGTWPVWTRGAVPRNVILIIGDGMGPGALKLTSVAQSGREGQLFLQTLPVASLCTTQPLGEEVTDSAAAGTAIACGRKTANGRIAMLPSGEALTSVATDAKRAGCAVGLITSDMIVGATPAVFYAHDDRRGDYSDIAVSMLTCGFDLLIGNRDGRAWFLPRGQAGLRSDDRDGIAELAARNYVSVSNIAHVAHVPFERHVVGWMSGTTVLNTESCLGELLEIAVTRLDRNPKGFFLMVEGALTDKGGHGNNPDLTILGTLQVDWAVRAAVAFACTRTDTLVMVTADHETGGLYSTFSQCTKSQPLMYTTTCHTSMPVLFYAMGPGADQLQGVIDNVDVGQALKRFFKRP